MSQVTHPLRGGAKIGTQAFCLQLPVLPRGQGLSEPEKGTLPQDPAGLWPAPAGGHALGRSRCRG